LTPILKNGFIISEEDAIKELITDLSRHSPGIMATRYKETKIETIKSIEQEIKSCLEDINIFLGFLEFSRSYNNGGGNIVEN